ncbi:hypothetical protein [Sphingomonas solaris]|uniref:Uncharacterized protein n=1 Tax=Alterirhizorhabdus solaris TaxID=2529389 RepID=A0A558R5V8_9SPHN|nr:hypothetical protein [Sphingomonas solaris]TVV74702.1 hypothetical protein FOY91_09045 [Sphingomonas solaris]
MKVYPSEDEVQRLLEELRSRLGIPLVTDLEQAAGNQLSAVLEDALSILNRVGDIDERQTAVNDLLLQLIPHTIDASLWADLAVGRNVDLPAITQYGPIEERLKPSSPRGAAGSRGNDYGRVHGKGTQEPSAFLKRQHTFLQSREKRVADLEAQLAEAKQDRDAVADGLKLYALTLFLTAIRKSVAPKFAMAAGWTVLDAISGPTGNEKGKDDEARQKQQQVDTQLILVTLHALRDEADFKKVLKRVLLQTCLEYRGAAHAKGREPWEGPFDYDRILAGLGWPEDSEAF